MRILFSLLVITTAAGCGQTGSLYLPDESVETPVEIRTQGEAEKEKKDEEKKVTPPPGR